MKLLLQILCPLVFFATNTSIFGQSTLVWTAANANSSWHDTLNWNLHKIPDSLDIAVISNAAGTMPNLTGSVYVRQLRLQTGTTLVVDTNAHLKITNPAYK